jgi:hypothetical protein
MASLDCELRRLQALQAWKDQLLKSNSVFVQLMHLSRLRDGSGRYADPFLLRAFSKRDCERILSEAHRLIFREWLAMSARRKLRDFKIYRDAICQRYVPDEPGMILCRGLVPSGISIDELNLFCQTTRRLARLISHPEIKRRFE